MKKLILLPLLLISIVGYSQMNTFGGIGLRVNDTTTYQANAAAYHTAGYYDIYFNNQATNDHYDVWNGSSYDHIFSFANSGSSGWNVTGTTTLTGPVLVTSADSIGIVSTDQINIRSSANSYTGFSTGNYLNGSASDFAFVGTYKDGTYGNIAFNIVNDATTGHVSYSSLSAWPSGPTAFLLEADTIVFKTGDSNPTPTRFKIDPNGSWILGTDPGTTGEVLTSNGSAAAPTWNTNSGTYTPTLTNTANVAASTAYVTGWFRVGTMITVFGKVDIDVTLSASTATELGLSLPVASNMTGEEDLGGTAISDSVASLAARIKGDATNDRASIVFKAISLTNDSYSFEFSYQVK